MKKITRGKSNVFDIAMGKSVRKPSLVHTVLVLMFVLGLVTSASAGKPPADSVGVTAAGLPAEDKIDPFLGEPKLEMQQLFKGERFPNIAVAVDGTVLATFGRSSVKIRRSEDGGKTWGKEITIARPGFQGGGLTVDEKTGDILAFVEDHHPPASLTVYRSKDHGKTWRPQKTLIL